MRRIFTVLLLMPILGFSQSVNEFLTPADSLHPARRTAVAIGLGVASGATIAGLHQLWYADYPKSSFHLVNDNAQWLQVDKAGHVYGSYHLSRLSSEMLGWAGVGRRDRLLYGTLTGLGLMTAIEVMDGHSAQWGASWGDMLANVGGAALFVSQELLWEEQRIIPKFSFHTTPYAGARPEVLGESVPQQVFKDYNGQTYWLSANVRSFWKDAPVPGWLNLSVGYGAEGMITGDDDFVNTIFFPEQSRIRQYYLSLDIDLTRIQTQSHFLKTLFSVLNVIKIPAPAIEFNSRGVVKGHLLYF